MHPEVINIRYFWIRFAIAAFGICGYAISMTAGIVISVKTKDQEETGWGASNLDWQNSLGSFHELKYDYFRMNS